MHRSIIAQCLHHAWNTGVNLNPNAVGWHVVIQNTKGEVWFFDADLFLANLCKSVMRSLMHKVAIHPEQGGSIVATQNLMRIPKFIKQGARLCHCTSPFI